MKRRKVTCCNCGRRIHGSPRRGRCGACDQYRRRHGRDSTASDRQTRSTCRNCQQASVASGGLCSACHRYQQRHGRPRPAHKWAERCQVCDRPLLAYTRVKGRCRRCHHYYYRTGRDRTHLARKERRQGWCDCGNPATTTRTVPVRQRATETYQLCDECAAIEAEWYYDGEAV